MLKKKKKEFSLGKLSDVYKVTSLLNYFTITNRSGK